MISLKISGTDTVILSECADIINKYENLFSRTIRNSDISKFNDSGDGAMVSPEVIELMEKAIKFADDTNGTFNPALGSVTELWRDSVPENIDLSHIDYKKLSLDGDLLKKSDSHLKLDLGGIAKGFITEKVTGYLIENGIEYGILSFGGNISAFGNRPDGKKWTIGIRDPYDINDIIGNLSIDGGYVSVSGDYQRYFIVDNKRYHHIIDPKTGYPVDNGVNSVIIWCNDGTAADALSTALFVMSVDDGMKFHESGLYDFEVMFITRDGLTMSEGFRQNFQET